MPEAQPVTGRDRDPNVDPWPSPPRELAGPRQPVRWARGPLVRYIDLALGRPATIAEIADRVGVARRTVHRWRERGLTDREADETAVRLGTVPALIWGTDAWCSAALGTSCDRALRARLAGRGLSTPSPRRPTIQATHHHGGDAA